MITRRKLSILAGAATLAAPSIVRAQQQVLKVGLIPSEDSRAMLAQSKDILDALEKNSGMKVQGFVASDYNGVIEALRAKHLDIAYLGPFSYVLATTVTPVEAFVIAETAKSGRTYYHSQIIALKSSGIYVYNNRIEGSNLMAVFQTREMTRKMFGRHFDVVRILSSPGISAGYERSMASSVSRTMRDRQTVAKLRGARSKDAILALLAGVETLNAA